jgi:tetratricopeptide (TPR) repeat protein
MICAVAAALDGAAGYVHWATAFGGQGNMNGQAQAANLSVRVGRNDRCPCGSGRKYKHCCQAKLPAATDASPTSSAPLARAKLNAMYDAAKAHAGAGRWSEAAHLFEALARQEPNNPTSLFNLGRTYVRCLRFKEAASVLQRAIELRPSHVETLINLITALVGDGRRPEALSAYRKLSRIADTSIQRRYYQAHALEIEGRAAEAEAVLRRTLAAVPAQVNSRVLLADLLLRRGAFEEAERHLGETLDALPSGFLSFTKARRMTEADRPLIERMRARAEEPQLDGFSRIHIHFGLGKAYEDLGDYAEAMRQYDQGNRLKAMSSATFNRAAMTKEYDSIIERFTAEKLQGAERLARPSAPGEDLPVFIVGMPRSGTTLVEQILSSHPAVAAGGELPFWWSKVRGPDGLRLEALDAEAMAQAAAGYLALLRSIGPSSLRVTDKLLGNFVRLGLLMAALPRARIIHCRRHPVATCLSIYFEHLESRWDFAHDRGNLAFVYRQYERLMEHWRGALPAGRLAEVEYEKLVNDREAETRRLIAFCGLDWDDACLQPQRNERAVKTASIWQARQPVYTSSVERWRRFEPWLAGLCELLPRAEAKPGDVAASQS